jgi:hypothetical protein
VLSSRQTYSNVVTYKCCTNRTVSNSECERLSDFMIVVVTQKEIVDLGRILWSEMCFKTLGIISVAPSTTLTVTLLHISVVRTEQSVALNVNGLVIL